VKEQVIHISKNVALATSLIILSSFAFSKSSKESNP